MRGSKNIFSLNYFDKNYFSSEEYQQSVPPFHIFLNFEGKIKFQFPKTIQHLSSLLKSLGIDRR